MDPDYEGSELEEGEEEAVPKPGLDYDKLDPDTGFKALEWTIWQAYDKTYLSASEDDREGEPEDWADTFAEENNMDKNRVLTAVKLGVYAGDRDEFSQRTGEGKCIHPNGDVYEGQYWEGKRNGKGTYQFKSMGLSEVPKLLRNMYESKGDEGDEEFITRAAGYLQIGEHNVRAAVKYGFFPMYNGMYVNDMRNGFGVMLNKDGSVYEGHWKNNKRHGEGVYYYLNGDKYQGQWEEGSKTGSGCYSYLKQKCQYVGVWQKDNFTEGQWKMPDGIYYEGRFDLKNQPSDERGALKFPHLDAVVGGSYDVGQWAPSKDIHTTEDYAKLDTEEPAEEEEGEEQDPAEAVAGEGEAAPQPQA